jgi:DnaK suppressor protein
MKEKRNNKVMLKPAEIERLKTLLLEKRRELLSNVSYMEIDALREERSDLSTMPIHMADLGTDSYEQEFTLELMDSERKVIADIDYALSRIEEGTYGVCEIGGEPIPKQRLEAIPWARFCISCAGLVEKGVVRKEELINKYDYAYGIDDEQDMESGNYSKED